MREIYRVIRRMGITAKYRGYYFVAEAIAISMESGDTPIMITKDIYPPIASKYKSTAKSVERAIRTVVELCWLNHRETMEEIAGYELDYKPTNSEFVDFMAYYIKENNK